MTKEYVSLAVRNGQEKALLTDARLGVGIGIGIGRQVAMASDCKRTRDDRHPNGNRPARRIDTDSDSDSDMRWRGSAGATR